jgi:hypothetical protein
MKIKRRNIASLLITTVLLTACEEEPPYINYRASGSSFDSTYVETPADPEPKEVLLEDITGVRCPNCPKAAEIAADLLHTHEGRLNVIAMQPKNFSNLLTKPFERAGGDHYDSRYDLRTDAAIAIANMVAKPNSLPSGYIDRKVFAPLTDPILDKEKWVEKVGLQVGQTSPVNLELKAVHDATQNTIVIDVTIRYTQAIAEEKSHNLSIAITQDSLIDVQENGSEYDSAYVSMHLLRDMATSYTGDALNAPLVAGRVFRKRYVYTIPPYSFTFPAFDFRNMHVVAYIHESGTGKEVLQSAHAEVTE